MIQTETKYIVIFLLILCFIINILTMVSRNWMSVDSTTSGLFQKCPENDMPCQELKQTPYLKLCQIFQLIAIISLPIALFGLNSTPNIRMLTGGYHYHLTIACTIIGIISSLACVIIYATKIYIPDKKKKQLGLSWWLSCLQSLLLVAVVILTCKHLVNKRDEEGLSPFSYGNTSGM